MAHGGLLVKRIILLSALISVLAVACGGAAAEPTTTTSPTTTSLATADATTTTASPTTTIVPVSTTAATTTTTVPSIVPGQDADTDAIVDLYAVVFDSLTTYDQKAPFIDDAEGLESTAANYTNAGEGVGGIFLEVKAVTVDGSTAAVVYDLLFARNPFVSAQDGDAVLNDGQWQVTREFFCSIMESARVGCPLGG
jgi:hypothetical protein